MTYNVTFPPSGAGVQHQPVAFSIGSFHVYWYGIIIAAGFLLALIYASFSCKKMNIDINRLFDVVIVGLIAGVIFARLFYVVFYPGDKYWKNPLEIFQIHDGGLAIYGGIIGAVVFGSLMAKLRKLRLPLFWILLPWVSSLASVWAAGATYQPRAFAPPRNCPGACTAKYRRCSGWQCAPLLSV